MRYYAVVYYKNLKDLRVTIKYECKYQQGVDKLLDLRAFQG